MSKHRFAFLSLLLCLAMPAFAQTEVKDSLGVDKPQANTPAALLKGRLSGVLVSATDGSPAGAVNTYIRGLNSLGDDSQPLWIVDGVMLNRSQRLNLDPFWNMPGQVYAPAFNELAFLNPYDIESVEVLKDVAATALYGSRGANGVIIVTTGKAKDKALDIRWDSNVSLSSAGQVEGTRSALGHNHSVCPRTAALPPIICPASSGRRTVSSPAARTGSAAYASGLTPAPAACSRRD